MQPGNAVPMILAIFITIMAMNRLFLAESDIAVLVAAGGFLVPELVRCILMGRCSLPAVLPFLGCLVQIGIVQFFLLGNIV